MSSLAEPGWEAIARTPQFRELVSNRRRFVAIGTAFYTGYLLAFLALLGYAKDFMANEVLGHLARALGRPQHLRADRRHGRALRAPRRALGGHGAPRGRGGGPMTPFAATGDFNAPRRRRLRRRAGLDAGDHPLGGQAHAQRDRVLRRRPRRLRPRQRRRDRRRLPQRLDVPGLRGPDVPVRLRRLDHRPRRLPVLPARALPARRADAQRRQVHRRRRARVPPAARGPSGSRRRSTRC